jgi:hypothetical protein
MNQLRRGNHEAEQVEKAASKRPPNLCSLPTLGGQRLHEKPKRQRDVLPSPMYIPLLTQDIFPTLAPKSRA